MNVAGYPINKAIQGADWLLNQIPGRRQLVQQYGPSGPHGLFQARTPAGQVVNIAQTLVPNPIVPEVSADLAAAQAAARGPEVVERVVQAGQDVARQGERAGVPGPQRAAATVAAEQRAAGAPPPPPRVSRPTTLAEVPQRVQAEHAAGLPGAPLSPTNPLGGAIPEPVVEAATRTPVMQQVRAHAANALGQLKAIAAASAKTPSPAREVVNSAIGQRDFDAVASNNFWQETIRPATERMALQAGEKDKGALLRQALALRLDAERNPAEVQEFLHEAVAKHPTLQRVIARAQTLTPDELALLDTINRYDQGRGMLRLDQDVQEGVLSYHVPHLWERTTKGREIGSPAGVGAGLRASSRFAKGRTVDTFVKGIAQGLVPRSLDIVDVNRIEDLDTAHVLMTRRIASDIVDRGLGRWAPSQPEGLVAVDSPAFDKTLAVEDKTGAPMVVRQRLWVTPETKDALGVLIGRDMFAQNRGLAAFQWYQGLVKRAELSISMFHDLNLMRMFAMSRPLEFAGGMLRGGAGAVADAARAAAQGKLGEAGRALLPSYTRLDPVRQGLDYLRTPTPTMERLVKGGLTTRRNQMIDAYLDTLAPEKKSFANQLQGFRNRALWDRLWTGLKAYDAMRSFEDAQTLVGQINPATRAPWTADAIAERVADTINKKYGGLHWERRGISVTTRHVMRAIMFAPDWLLSNLGFTADGLRGLRDLAVGRPTVESRVAAKHLAMLALTWQGTSQALNILFTGHTTFQNEPGHEFQVQLPWQGKQGQPLYVDLTTPSAFLTILHTASGVERQGIPGLLPLLQARLAPGVRTAMGLIGNVDWTGRPIMPKGAPPLDQARAAAGYAGANALPVPFTATSAYQAATGQVTAPQAAAQVLGIGTASQGSIAPVSLLQRLPRTAKAEFYNNLTPQDRADFAAQYASGQFTGRIASLLWSASDRASYSEGQVTQRAKQMAQQGDVRGAITWLAQHGRDAKSIRLLMLPYLERAATHAGAAP